jgi:hypothetical protein
MEGLECNKWGEMSVTETIFVRWELVLTNDVYIRNGSGTNIGARLSRCNMTIGIFKEWLVKYYFVHKIVFKAILVF